MIYIAATASITSVTLVDLDTSFPTMPDANYTNLSTLRATAAFTWSGFTVSNKPFCTINTTLFTSDNSLIQGTPLLSSQISTASGSTSLTLDIPLNFNSTNYGYLLDNTSYQIKIAVNVYDSAKTLVPKASNTLTHDFTFWRYNLPTVPSFSAARCLSNGTLDESGENVVVSASYAISSLNSVNEKHLYAYSKVTSDTEWTLDTTFNLSALGYSETISSFVLANTYLGNASYDLKIVAGDTINTASNIKPIPVTTTTLELDVVDHRISIGKRLEVDSPQLDVAEDGRFGGSLSIGDTFVYSPTGVRFPIAENDFISTGTYAPFFKTELTGGAATSGDGDANHPGVEILWSGSTTPSGCSISTNIESLLLAGGEVFHAVFKINQLSSVIYLGFCDAFIYTSGTVTDGAYMKLNGSHASGNTSSNSIASATSASTYTLLADTWYHARIEIATIDSVVTALFSLMNESGTLLWTDSLNTNVPTGAGRRVGAGVYAITSYATNLQIARLDYLGLHINRDLVR